VHNADGVSDMTALAAFLGFLIASLVIGAVLYLFEALVKKFKR
jgi:Na+/citrate or Na+/malate symporter